jgi:hypothetical protein
MRWHPRWCAQKGEAFASNVVSGGAVQTTPPVSGAVAPVPETESRVSRDCLVGDVADEMADQTEASLPRHDGPVRYVLPVVPDGEGNGYEYRDDCR